MLGKASDRCLAFVDLLCSSFPFESFESCPAVRLCMLWRVLTGILTCFPIMSQLIHSSNPGRLCSAALLFFFQGEGKSASRELHVQEPSAASSMARRFRGFGGHARWSSMIQSNMSNMSNICPTETIEIQSTYSMKQHYDIHWHSILVHICSYLFKVFIWSLSLFISVFISGSVPGSQVQVLEEVLDESQGKHPEQLGAMARLLNRLNLLNPWSPWSHGQSDCRPEQLR